RQDIVQPITVLVMNQLICEQAPSYFLLHDMPVLHDELSGDAEDTVAVGGNASSAVHRVRIPSFPETVTLPGAVLVSPCRQRDRFATDLAISLLPPNGAQAFFGAVLGGRLAGLEELFAVFACVFHT